PWSRGSCGGWPASELLRHAGAAALDRPGRLPAPQPRPCGDRVGGGADRPVLRPGRRGRPAGVRRRVARRRAECGLPATGALPLGAGADHDVGRRGARRLVPDPVRPARRAGRRRPGRDRRVDPDGDLRPPRGPSPQARPAGAGLPHPVGTVTALSVPDADERGDLGAFVARVVRLDPAATARLRAGAGTVTAWASTPFDVLATRTVHGQIEPPDVTVSANALLTALAVEKAATV